jgi:hypothetical protein
VSGLSRQRCARDYTERLTGGAETGGMFGSPAVPNSLSLPGGRGCSATGAVEMHEEENPESRIQNPKSKPLFQPRQPRQRRQHVPTNRDEERSPCHTPRCISAPIIAAARGGEVASREDGERRGDEAH